MGDVKNLTSTSFGLVIAFLLPGFAGLATLGIWLDPISEAFRAFTTEEANIGLLFVVTVGALLLGLLISLVRMVLLETLWLGRPTLDEKLKNRIPTNLAEYRATIDETYRYHQFWGGMAVVIPGVVIGLGRTANPSLIVVLYVVEFLTLYGAAREYKGYVNWAEAALGSHPANNGSS